MQKKIAPMMQKVNSDMQTHAQKGTVQRKTAMQTTSQTLAVIQI